MRKLFGNAAILLMAALIGFTSCDDDNNGDPQKKNAVEIDGAKTALSSGGIDLYSSDGLDVDKIALFSEGTTFTEEGPTGTGYYILFQIASEAGKGVDGTYVPATDESEYKAGEFSWAGCYRVENGEILENDNDDFVKGTIQVKKISVDNYEVSGNVTNKGGKKVQFYYKGKLAPVDMGA